VSSADRRRAHTSDDYLFALSMLTTPVVSCGARATDLPTLAAHVARSLGVSRSAAGEMVQRLEREGLIEHGPHKEILLTDSLGYTPAESYGLALQIRDGCDDTLIERIAAQLTLPERCPHGWPIEVSEEHAEMAELVSLAALRAGAATVVALLESDEDTLTYLGALGIEPDAEVRVLDGGAGQIAVEVDGRQCVLDRDRASTVFVRSTIQ
jgi:Mn-dependent DtxR family transcriptional regulator